MSAKTLKVADVNTTTELPAQSREPDATVSPGRLKIAAMEAQLAAMKAVQYAKENPVKTTGYVATVGLAAYGAYRAIRDITG